MADFIDTFKPFLLLMVAVVGFAIVFYVYLPKILRELRGKKDKQQDEKKY